MKKGFRSQPLPVYLKIGLLLVVKPKIHNAAEDILHTVLAGVYNYAKGSQCSSIMGLPVSTRAYIYGSSSLLCRSPELSLRGG